MKKVFAWFKQHPLTLVLIIGVGVLVIVLFSGSSSGAAQTTAGVAVDPNAAAEIAASTALQQTQIQAGVQTTGISAQVAEAQIAANSDAYTANLNATTSLAGISAQKDVQLAGISGQVQLADLQNQASLAQSQVYAGIFNKQAEEQETQYNDAAAVQINSQNVSGAIALAPYTTVQTLANTGNLSGLGTIKDSYLNLPGLSVGRGTNFTPPGATPGQPSGLNQFLGGFAGGLIGAFG